MKLRKLFIFTTAALAAGMGTLTMADYDKMQDSKMKETTMSVPHATITFNAGSSMLTEADKASLRKLVRDADSKGTISQISVAAWSDKALPHMGQKLLDTDRNLASNRADAIKTFLKSETEIKDVETFSMAETANWLARTFYTRDAELKSVFGRTGAEVPLTKDEFQAIKQEGGPSMAVAVVEYKAFKPSEAPAPAPTTVLP
ncbi:MAG: hypothetical protein ACXWQO_12445 [Bdellovibrionota bacterium]